jgi:glyceraldehyde-3-phosphate dehydrogenase (ferredoxin)
VAQVDSFQKVLFVDAGTGYSRSARYDLSAFCGPVDLGLHLAGQHNCLAIGIGMLAGSIVPGSNRLIFSGFSPCWGGFYVSSMGGAGLVFENLGISTLAIVGRAGTPSVLYLNRRHGEEIDIAVEPVDVTRVWADGRRGVYALMDHVLARYGSRYEETPRILTTGPAALATDFGGIVSAPIENGQPSYVDTWAGRGGMGTKLLAEHGIAAVIYGGTFIDEDFRDRKVADAWFERRYQKKLAAKDLEATTKYRFDPKFDTGGTFGVNFATVGGGLLAFNYRSIYWEESERVELHRKLVREHYLQQFNEETIKTRQQRTCGEPCAAVCKKLNGEFKKDYEPYQVMGPLTGIFDQRAAELLNHHADTLGFDAISAGGVLAWLMDCLDEGLLTSVELGVDTTPVFAPAGFRVVEDSMHNAELGIRLLDGIIARSGPLDLLHGARRRARRLARVRGKRVLDLLVHTGYARKGWMVPNQYWTPGVLSPMPIMGKYYQHYGQEFLPPRTLGRVNAERMRQELILDIMGICRFHRGWAEEMLPEIWHELFGPKEGLLAAAAITAGRINSRNSSVFWESERTIDLVHTYLKRRLSLAGSADAELVSWLARFDADKGAAALDFWYEVHKGTHESLREF